MTLLASVLFALALLFAALGGAAAVARVFRDEPDDALRNDVVLGLALPAGLVLAALPGWMLSALSGLSIGTREIVPVSIDRVVLPLAAIALLGALALWGKELLSALGPVRRLVLPLAFFLALFLGFVWLRLPTGEVRGTEKPMDLAVLSNLMTTSGLPLADPWMSGERFPYYYFGTFLFALPARAARLHAGDCLQPHRGPPPGRDRFRPLRRRPGAGGKRSLAVFGGLLAVIGGTPDGLRQWLSGQALPDIDFWASSRRVQNAITEWPLFTFRLADLHPHAMTLPILVAFMAVAGRVASVPGVFLDAVTAGAVLSANPWDLPAVLLILAAGNLAEREVRATVIRSAATLGIAAVVLDPLLPIATAAPPRNHVLPERHDGRRGFPPLRRSPRRPGPRFRHRGGPVADAPGRKAPLRHPFPRDRNLHGHRDAATRPRPSHRLSPRRRVVALPQGGRRAGRRHSSGRCHPGGLSLRRRGGGAGRRGGRPRRDGHVRRAAPADEHDLQDLVRRMAAPRPRDGSSSPGRPLGPAGSNGDPRRSSFSRSRQRRSTRYPPSRFRLRLDGGSLDGLAWMSREMPGDRLAVEWLRRHARPDAVIAEATGNPYSDFGRIGVASGRPTLLGWANHEGLWRAEAGDAEIHSRQNDLQTLYLSMDPPSVLDVIKRRKIDYIVLGPLEYKVFGPNALPTRGGLHRVFDESGTAIYEPNP